MEQHVHHGRTCTVPVNVPRGGPSVARATTAVLDMAGAGSGDDRQRWTVGGVPAPRRTSGPHRTTLSGGAIPDGVSTGPVAVEVPRTLGFATEPATSCPDGDWVESVLRDLAARPHDVVATTAGTRISPGEGLVRAEETAGKRVYHLTEAGQVVVDSRRGEPTPWETPAESLDDGVAELKSFALQVGERSRRSPKPAGAAQDVQQSHQHLQAQPLVTFDERA